MFTQECFLLLFLVNMVAVLQFDMKCECGKKEYDADSERDCEESARLESGDQEFNIRYLIFCFT